MVYSGREVWSISRLAFAQGIPILFLSINLKNYHEHADSLRWHLPASLYARFLTPALKLPGKDDLADLAVALERVTGHGRLIGSQLLPKALGGSTAPEPEDLAYAAPALEYEYESLSHLSIDTIVPPKISPQQPQQFSQHRAPPLCRPRSTNTMASLLLLFAAALLLAITLNILHQLLPFFKSPTEPPLVFHTLPLLGSTIPYGRDPCAFLTACRANHGDIFTFILLGKKTTVYLGPAGNEFILNGRLRDLCAEDVYGPLTTPVFGPGVIYDCDNARLMEHKRFVKAGLTRKAMATYARLIEGEVRDYVKTCGEMKGREGTWDVPEGMAKVTMYTAARTLQGGEVRRQLTGEMAGLYHDLDMGFQPVNFVAPWLPLPANRRRDVAQKRLRGLYLGIIEERRRRELNRSQTGKGEEDEDEEPDMLWTLMRSVYKDGTPMDDGDTASLMVALLLGGQHSSSAAGTWMLLELTARPELQEELFEEQRRLGGEEGGGFRPELADVDKMPLMMGAVKETLRVHSSINSIMRRVKNPIPVPGTRYVIPPGRTMLASTSVMHMSEEYYARPEVWDPRRWEGKVEEEREEDMVDYGYGTVNKGTRSPYLPFGAGRHRCIGESFAYLNLCTIMATLVREFRFLPTDEKWVVPPTDYSSMFAMATRPAIVRWEKR